MLASGQDSLADFGTLSLTNSPTVALDGPQVVGSLKIDVASGSGLYGWLFNASSTGSYLGGSLTLTASTGPPVATVSLPNTGPSDQINAALAGTGGFDKQGPGLLILSNTNNPLSGGHLGLPGVSEPADQQSPLAEHQRHHGRQRRPTPAWHYLSNRRHRGGTSATCPSRAAA